MRPNSPAWQQIRQSVTPGAAASPPAGIFRAYDIRGLAGTELTPDNIYLIGLALAELTLASGRRQLLFAADGRLSSPLLAPPLREGLQDGGCDVIDLGMVPTPLLYFATWNSDTDSGVMLTASHNPAEYNGIKFVLGRHCLTPEQITALHHRTQELAKESGAGRRPRARRASCASLNIVPAYIAHVSDNVRPARALRVVLDCGNAVPGVVGPALLSALGCDVVPLYCDVDGHFPNHHPDPTIADNLTALIEAVRSERADIGFALDGDGDRVVAVSNSGAVIDTDRLLMLLVRDILPRHPGANVIFDVKCSSRLTTVIQEAGGQPVMTRSGHSFMKEKMHETGAVLGGEFSAHIFVSDRWYGHDDGLYVAARVLEMVAGQPGDVDSLLATLPASRCTPELRIPVSEQRKFPLMKRLAGMARFDGARMTRIDGIRADFDDGWGLLRASNTTPALLLRFEADDGHALDRIQESFRALLQQADAGLDIPF